MRGSKSQRLPRRFTLWLALVLTLAVPSHAGPQRLDSGPVIRGQNGTLLPDGRWLLMGGEGPTGQLATAQIWDPRTGLTLPVGGELQHPRAWHSATLLPDGRVLIWGGIGRSGQVVDAAELFNPETERFEPLSVTGLTLRASHTATVLTDGRVLIVGGLSVEGTPLAQAEVWDVQSHAALPVPAALATARHGHTATLLPNGAVLIWGGMTQEGVPLSYGELYDPVAQQFAPVQTFPVDVETELPELRGSLPEDGATEVPIGSRITLRFSKPLRVETLTPETVFLVGPTGPEPINITPAEAGRLAFITPAEALFGGRP